MTENRASIEMIAVRFAETDRPRGWGILDKLGISPLTVVPDGGDPINLVYMFSSTYWDRVQSSLIETRLPYAYKKAPSLSKRIIDDPTTWISMPPQEILG